MTDEEKKAIKVINKRTERLSEELKIEQEDFIDEPRIAYLITQIEANETLLKLLEKQEKVIDEMAKEINRAYYDENNFYLDFEKNIIPDGSGCISDRIAKLKQYFYRKVEVEND